MNYRRIIALFGGEELDDWEPSQSYRLVIYEDDVGIDSKNFLSLYAEHSDVFNIDKSDYNRISLKNGGLVKWAQLERKRIVFRTIDGLSQENDIYIYDTESHMIIFNSDGRTFGELEELFPKIEKAIDHSLQPGNDRCSLTLKDII